MHPAPHSILASLGATFITVYAKVSRHAPLGHPEASLSAWHGLDASRDAGGKASGYGRDSEGNVTVALRRSFALQARIPSTSSDLVQRSSQLRRRKFWTPDCRGYNLPDRIEKYDSNEAAWEYIERLVSSNSPENQVVGNYWAEHTYWVDRRPAKFRKPRTPLTFLTFLNALLSKMHPRLARRSLRRRHRVVIYSDEELKENVDLDISLQIKHETTNPVISASLASHPCTALGVDGLLAKLNEVLRTSYTLDTPGLLPHLQQCLSQGYDFGTAFGRLRQFWFDDFRDLHKRLTALEQADRTERDEALDAEKGIIQNSSVSPRRVWDLYSNRVLPIWVTRLIEELYELWAVSHSWVAEEQRHSVDTPINGHEWHVPLPKDADLDRVRVELLNLGAEYVWLDVLCLRQEDKSKPEREDVRIEEWKLDVPTIGNVYPSDSFTRVVTYFEGLGRPFHGSDVGSGRHWVNRAWTLQETNADTFIGGLTARSPFPPKADSLDETAKKFYAAFTASAMTKTMVSQGEVGGSIFRLVDVMHKRSAVSQVDKIAGLAYLTKSDALPAYIRGKDDSEAHEQAWDHVVKTMLDDSLMQLIFVYPAPGDGPHTWIPTWRQLISAEMPLPHAIFDPPLLRGLAWNSALRQLEQGYVLYPCTVQGLQAAHEQAAADKER
ncbi:hypothetical protein NM688_g5445 [Phlebia brevispora]|uniref:Uncharacterized protein n=1 Tax=Phlebia brevispora TaxID=194682 RepID=A0ACC1SV30_9APHY|nr:hypothetical protein NM688_g5445 [Phlebia brevispora]